MCKILLFQYSSYRICIDFIIRVLLYSGEFDLNCNTLGVLHVLESNTWLGRYIIIVSYNIHLVYRWRLLVDLKLFHILNMDRPWSTAKRSLWKFGKDVAGEYSEIGDTFAFLVVRNAGIIFDHFP